MQVPAKIGRSTKYSDEWAEAFCREISQGHSVAEICERRDQPSQQSVYTWLRGNEDFLERYARAREAQADKLFKECLTIADAARPEDANVARLRVDTRKWASARLAPKKYGDRVSHDVKGAGINFQPQILISCTGAGEEQEYIDISATSEAADSLPQQGNGNSLVGSGGRR
jgi:Bacteriophage Sf6, terminase small subunit-like